MSILHVQTFFCDNPHATETVRYMVII